MCYPIHSHDTIFVNDHGTMASQVSFAPSNTWRTRNYKKRINTSAIEKVRRDLSLTFDLYLRVIYHGRRIVISDEKEKNFRNESDECTLYEKFCNRISLLYLFMIFTYSYRYRIKKKYFLSVKIFCIEILKILRVQILHFIVFQNYLRNFFFLFKNFYELNYVCHWIVKLVLFHYVLSVRIIFISFNFPMKDNLILLLNEGPFSPLMGIKWFFRRFCTILFFFLP